MRSILLSAAAITLGLVIAAQAEAAHHSGNKSSHVSANRSQVKNSYKNTSFSKSNKNTSFMKSKGNVKGYSKNKGNFNQSKGKFAKGYDKWGKCHSWSHYCWSGRFGCYCYYCPTSCCWYYWDEPQCCFCPVTCLTVVNTVGVAQPDGPSAPPCEGGTATATATASASSGPALLGPGGPPAP
jgi:hypothetical protein